MPPRLPPRCPRDLLRLESPRDHYHWGGTSVWRHLGLAGRHEQGVGVPELLAELRELAIEQKSLDSRKQAVTRRMNETLEEGRKAASALKVNLKHKFGNRNEELLRFGIQPLRRKRRPAKPEPSPDGEASA